MKSFPSTFLRRRRLSALGLLAGVGAVLVPTAARAQSCPPGSYCYYAPPTLNAPLMSPDGFGTNIVLASPAGTISGTYSVNGGAPSPFSVTSGTPLLIPFAADEGKTSGYLVPEKRGTFIVGDSSSLVVDQRMIATYWQSSSTIKNNVVALGKRFRAGAYTLNNANGADDAGYDYISVYAPSGANVTVEAPPAAVAPFWNDGIAGLTHLFSLQVGQTYLMRSQTGKDIDGALITSDLPISVSVGGRGWDVCAGDDGMDHIVPVNLLGKQFVVDDYPSSGNEHVRVITDSDSTDVYIDGVFAITINAGEVYEPAISTVTFIETSKPAYVYQNAGLAGCENDIAMIPPVSFAALASTNIAFNVLGTGTANIIIPTAFVNSITLDGAAPGAPQVIAVPTHPEYSRVRFNVPGGDHAIGAGSDFQLGLVSTSAGAGTGLFAYYNPYRLPGCGDSTVDASEGCDDGNVADGDGCSAICQVEPYFDCTGQPSTCAPLDTDGDGISDLDEIKIGYDPTMGDADGDGILDPADLDLDNDGIPNVVECNAGALSLVNGSFELPPVNPNTVNYFDEAQVPGWDTTAGDNVMEFWGTGFNGVPAADGGQFVELNANEVSTLYQDVSTTPGQIYYYRFYHRGRSGPETMTFYVGAPGSPVKIKDVTTGTAAWQLVNGTVAIPAGQAVSRFSFESLTGGSSGNFLDGIAFTPGCTVDTDADGTLDLRDTDADNDGLLDGAEAGHGLAGGDGVVPGPYGTNGLANSTETGADSGSINYTLADWDMDGVPDFQDPDQPPPPDTDGDGLSDDDEIALGLDPNNADADGDGIQDPADNDLDNDGIPNDIECNAASLSLVNGSFELPDIAEGVNGFSDDSMVPGWDTTASDHQMEFWGNGFLGVPAADGSQFVELNAFEVSTLYQDVTTTPGQPYLYRFYHRGRSGPETMTFYVGAPGSPVKITDVTTDTSAWQLVKGVYVVPPGQTTSRFSFESLSGGSAGNFLDGIAFTPGCTTDTDNDATPDFRDTDSDADGLLDGIEAGHESAGPNGVVPGPYGTNGLADTVETAGDSGSLNYTLLDWDNDGIPDFQDPDQRLDTDGDGLFDDEEIALGLDPDAADADGDGILDPLDQDLDNDGIPNVIECDASALSIVNGSFEEPKVQPGTVNYFDEAQVPGWDTTASDNVMEFWGTGFLGVPAADGGQFVELNANEVSTLYQDVATTPGETYLYRFFHRGRSGPETMTFYVGAPGSPVKVRDVTTDTSNWQLVSGLYVVPPGQMTSRFSFESLSGGSSGNFLDGITFTPACTVDTDNDGTLDFRDMDSDDDGLPDGVEAGHGQAGADGTVPGPYGTNGLADSVEMNADSGSIGYTVADSDGDMIYDFRDVDSDNDGTNDGTDVFPTDPTEDTDTDKDGIGDNSDNCVTDPNQDQADADMDGVGDACEPDTDKDGVIDDIDNCVMTPNMDQADADMDDIGDVCEADSDMDGVVDDDDNCVDVANMDQADADKDGVGDVCEPDADDDGVIDDTDNCKDVANKDQADLDSDMIGDACDPDKDGDTVANDADNCPEKANTDQRDSDADGSGDACDPPPDEDSWYVSGNGCSCTQAGTAPQGSSGLLPLGAAAIAALSALRARRRRATR